MGIEVNNKKTILLSAVIFCVFIVAFVVIALVEPQDLKYPNEQEIPVTVSAPQKIQETSSGQIAGVLERPTVVNMTEIDNSSNKTE
jgi:hypothetical protein